MSIPEDIQERLLIHKALQVHDRNDVLFLGVFTQYSPNFLLPNAYLDPAISWWFRPSPTVHHWTAREPIGGRRA